MTNAPTKIKPIMARNTIVATMRTGLNIYYGIGFNEGLVEGNRDSTHQLELCAETDEKPCSSEGNDSSEGIQNCDSTQIGSG